MFRINRWNTAACVMLLLSSAAHSGAHAGKEPRQLGQYSGFEGNEEVLGVAVAETLKGIKGQNGVAHDFTGREKELGLAMSKVIKTLTHDSGYQHEMNDALVKMTLEFIQYAKDQNALEEVARKDAMTQFPMLKRVGDLITKTGNKQLALVALTDQTTCFFQLAGDVERGPGYVSYRAPYGHVLEQTRRMGMHDLTEQEIHERWTIPHIEVWSDILGVDVQITPWQEDGMITMSIPEITESVAQNN